MGKHDIIASMWMLKRMNEDGTFRKGQAIRSGLITTIPWHLE